MLFVFRHSSLVTFFCASRRKLPARRGGTRQQRNEQQTTIEKTHTEVDPGVRQDDSFGTGERIGGRDCPTADNRVVFLNLHD